MLDFDNIDDWAPRLTAELRPYIPNSIEQTLVEAELEYVEDAQEIFFELTDRDVVIDAVVAWLRSRNIAGYHGSRLTDEETDSVLTDGLIPLVAETRCDRLRMALSPHPRWSEVEAQLDTAIQAHGRGNRAGNREGQVHLTLSRTSLTRDFNHYLKYGSEFDIWVARSLLGSEEILANYGKPRVFEVTVPGDLALDAANQHFTVNERRNRGEIPILVDKFLKCWCYRLADPSFQSQTLRVDCGMVFRQTVPASWIISFETLSEI